MAIVWRTKLIESVDNVNMRIKLERVIDGIVDFIVEDIILKSKTVNEIIDHFATLSKQKLDERSALALPLTIFDIDTKLGSFEQRVQNQ